jgi:hypothetical protein
LTGKSITFVYFIKEQIFFREKRALRFHKKALVHNAGKLKFGAKKRGEKEKSFFEQLDTLKLAAYGPREHI